MSEDKFVASTTMIEAMPENGKSNNLKSLYTVLNYWPHQRIFPVLLWLRIKNHVEINNIYETIVPLDNRAWFIFKKGIIHKWLYF